jgi:hypothetical protein
VIKKIIKVAKMIGTVKMAKVKMIKWPYWMIMKT